MHDRTGSRSASRQVAASRFCLGATIAMFLSGPGTSAAAPWIFLLLVRDPGASLAAPAAGHFASRYSDHTGKDPVLFRMSAVAGFLGWVGLALLISWTPFIISIALLAVSGATAAQIVAAIHDELSDKRDDANERVVAISRMPRAGRWIVGPVSGAWVAAAYGVCPMLWMAAPLRAFTGRPSRNAESDRQAQAGGGG